MLGEEMKKWVLRKLRRSAFLLEREAKDYIDEGTYCDLKDDREWFGRRGQELMGHAKFLRDLAK